MTVSQSSILETYKNRFIFKKQRLRILVVEDDPVYLTLLKDLFKDINCDVHFCITCSSALDVMKVNDFDLIWLDIFFPGMSGFEMTVNLIKDEIEIPVIFVTGVSLTEDLIENSNKLNVLVRSKPTNAAQIKSLLSDIGALPIEQ